MKSRWRSLLSWGITFPGVLLLGCTRAGDPDLLVSPTLSPPPVREDLLDLNEGPIEPEYWLEWGDLRIPIERRANPNIYDGRIELELAEFQAVLDQKMELFKGRRSLELEWLSAYRPPYFRASPWRLSDPAFHQGVLGPSERKLLERGAAYGDEWLLNLYSPTDSIRIQSVHVQIRDPYAGYNPAVKVSEEIPLGEIHGFQIISQTGRPPLLRIDTTEETTRDVLDLYRQYELYRILHVPDFRTRRRLLTDADRLFDPRDIRRTELLGTGPDWLTLPEYTDLDRRPVMLKWGGMQADPTGDPYDLEFFRTAVMDTLSLQVGSEKLRIQGFHLIINSQRTYPRLYVASEIGRAELQKDLLKTGEAASVYFDRLLVADDTGRSFLFPVTFAFHVDVPQPFDLVMEEAGRDGGLFFQEEERPGGWTLEARHLPLPDLLASILSESRGVLLLDGFATEPCLNVRFTSDRMSPREGRDLLLRKLMDKYHFAVHPNESEEAYFLRLTDAERLLPLETQERRRTGWAFLEMRELSRVLSEELDAWVVDGTATANRRFRLSIPRGSPEEVQEKLHVLGLQLEPLDREVRFLIRRYGSW